MKKNYVSINATFGSAALDLSTLPAYGESQKKRTASIIEFEEIAPKKRCNQKSKREVVMEMISSTVAYVRYDMFKAAGTASAGNAVQKRAAKSKVALTYCAAIACVCAILFLGM